MTTTLPKSLIDEPSFLAESFAGYEHHTDPTRMDFNKLTFPSVNCSIPFFDKIVPDLGKTLLGQAFTENVGIIGHKEKFKNMGGIEMEVRVWPSANNTLADVIEIYYRNNRLLFSGLVGAFQVGETITGGTSGATAVVVSILNTVLGLSNITADFIVGEMITGGTSGATATIVSAPISTWHQITENNNPLPPGVHEYYFDEYFDTNLNPALTRRLPRLIWVNGFSQGFYGVTGEVYSWTGGIALITAVTATTITIDPSTTWRSLGFTEDDSAAGGNNAYVVVNGVSYQLANPSDLDTNSIDVTDTTGIAVGDIATSRIEVDESPIPFDVCRMNKNYMFYGNWNQRDLYMSNGFNRPSTMLITNAQALQNDLIIPAGAVYTGTGSHVYHIAIDSVTPAVNEQSFNGTGINDAGYDTSGYTDIGDNTYKVLIVADAGLTFNGTPSPIPTPGEVLVGNASGAQAYVISLDSGGEDPILRMFPGSVPFQVGETVTGTISGPIPQTLASFTYHDWFQVYKNNIVIQPGAPYSLPPGFYFAEILTTPGTLFDIGDGSGLQFSFENYVGHTIGDYWTLHIQSEEPDTFKWWIDDGAPTTGVTITGGIQTLGADGVEIQFGSDVGHQLGDLWDISVNQSITRAWVNFYYTLPVRKPGEGYIYRLPSNFWTMDTQEESMYVNGSYGEWGFVSTLLSGDLQREDVSLTPLKQVGALKVLYPYLTGHINDDLIFVTIDKKLKTLGREQFLEKPQTAYLSDKVDLDFQSSTFIGGRIKYLNQKVYISSPENGITHCYDTYREYWQPPKLFPEVGILSIFENDLVAHSNVRNQSFTMFTNSAGDNNQNYQVEIRFPYTALGDRWGSKLSSMSFTEGYIKGTPPLVHTVYCGVNGCGGIFPHDIGPVVCVAPDRAPFGEGPFGSHPFGSDLAIEGDYFQEIFKSYSPVMQYYLVSLGISCIAKSHTYAILSTGLNAMWSESGNNSLINRSNLVT